MQIDDKELLKELALALNQHIIYARHGFALDPEVIVRISKLEALYNKILLEIQGG